jgi:hypothetical protein
MMTRNGRGRHGAAHSRHQREQLWAAGEVSPAPMDLRSGNAQRRGSRGCSGQTLKVMCPNLSCYWAEPDVPKKGNSRLLVCLNRRHRGCYRWSAVPVARTLASSVHDWAASEGTSVCPLDNAMGLAIQD